MNTEDYKSLEYAIWSIADELTKQKKLVTKRIIAAILEKQSTMPPISIDTIQRALNAWRLQQLHLTKDELPVQQINYTAEKFAEKVIKLETELCQLRAKYHASLQFINELQQRLQTQTLDNKSMKEFCKTKIKDMLQDE